MKKDNSKRMTIMFHQIFYKQRPRNENALTMLRDKKLRRGTTVWTADGHDIGNSIRLHHRQNDVNPGLKLYASYLELFSILLGGATYIPTDFIRDYDPADNKLLLSVTLKDIAKETWDRTPAFIAHHQATTETLA
ncbi:MAG: hypothetical protein CL608_20450 [Anaerolineaceae bacterium]|nr:hypothetical protein [Anaerolineaceae bacterium]